MPPTQHILVATIIVLVDGFVYISVTKPCTWLQSQNDQGTMNKNKHLQILREVRTVGGRKYHQCFSIEGYRLIERALGSPHPLQAVVVEDRVIQAPTPREQQILAQLEEQNCLVNTARTEELQEFTEGRTFGPMMGLVPKLPSADLSYWLTEESLPCTLLVLVDVKDPGNLGALMRTGRASGADALLIVGGTDPFHPKAARTSMGAIFDIPILSGLNRETLQQQLSSAQIQTIGAVVLNGTAPYKQKPTHRCALFMGSEAHGLPMEMQSQFDIRWTIPMHGDIDSYSINAATAILLYEVNRP